MPYIVKIILPSTKRNSSICVSKKLYRNAHNSIIGNSKNTLEPTKSAKFEAWIHQIHYYSGMLNNDFLKNELYVHSLSQSIFWTPETKWFIKNRDYYASVLEAGKFKGILPATGWRSLCCAMFAKGRRVSKHATFKKKSGWIHSFY